MYKYALQNNICNIKYNSKESVSEKKKSYLKFIENKEKNKKNNSIHDILHKKRYLPFTIY